MLCSNDNNCNTALSLVDVNLEWPLDKILEKGQSRSKKKIKVVIKIKI